MGLLAGSLTSLVDGLRSYVNGPLYTRDPALKQYLSYGSPTASGIAVDEDSALRYPAVWAAINLVAGTIGALPLELFRRLPSGGREAFVTHPVYRLIHDDFNPELSSAIARQTMQAHVEVYGNAYAEIERDNAGRPLALWVLTPTRVKPDRDSNGALIYRYRRSQGADIIIPADDILHIRRLSFDGVTGYSAISYFRETIGLAQSTQRYGAQFFGNGAVSSLVAKHPGQLSTTAHENLKKDLTQQLTGERRHSILILEENMSVEKISIPPDDAQFLETQKFSVSEIARIFGVPPHKIGDLERATFSNIFEENIAYMRDGIVPRISIGWEPELNRKLIRPLERSIQYTKFNQRGYLRGDPAAEAARLKIEREWGIINADEWRDLEDLNPLPDGQGKVYLVPMNMTDAARLDEVIDAQIRPPAPPPPPAASEPDPAPEPARSNPERAQIIAAQRTHAFDVLARMQRRECQTIRRALKKGRDGLRICREEFYPKHREMLGDALADVMRGHLALMNSERDFTEETAHVVSTHIDQSWADLDALADDFSSADQLIARWEQQRPAHVADALMAEEIKHAVA